MKNLIDLFPQNVRHACASAIVGATANFQQYHHIAPVMLAQRGERLVGLAVSLEDAAKKKEVLSRISALKKDCDIVIFIIEAWTCHTKTQEETQRAIDEGLAQQKNRGEAVIINFYLPQRTVIIQAKISRDPAYLNEWELIADTQNPSIETGGNFVL